MVENSHSRIRDHAGTKPTLFVTHHNSALQYVNIKSWYFLEIAMPYSRSRLFEATANACYFDMLPIPSIVEFEVGVQKFREASLCGCRRLRQQNIAVQQLNLCLQCFDGVFQFVYFPPQCLDCVFHVGQFLRRLRCPRRIGPGLALVKLALAKFRRLRIW